MSTYQEKATIKNLDRNEYAWNPDFRANMDDKGKWTGSESFTCRLKDVTKLLPTMGANCTLEGWEFLTSTTVSVENIEGDLAQVTIGFSSYQENNFTFDENNLDNYTYDLQIQTSEQPLITHPKTIAPYGNMTEQEKIHLTKYINGAWDRNETLATKQLFDTTDPTKTFTFSTSDGIKFLDYYTVMGRESFYYPNQVWRISYTTKNRPSNSLLNDVGKIKDPKGAPSLAGGRNWLFNGLSISQKDRIYTVTEEYIMSDAQGWDNYLYEEA